MQRTYEWIETAEKILELYKDKLDYDEVIAATILHDFGKIFEYILNEDSGIIDYEPNFRSTWLSHSQWGFTKCMEAGFPRVAKMIAAHHGRLDWGSIIDLGQKDLEPYVYIIHHIDDLSAKFGKISVTDL